MDCCICGSDTLNPGWICLKCELTGFSTPQLVIGICGRARHGKDSIAGTIKLHFESKNISCFCSSVSTLVFETAVILNRVKAARREDCTTTELNELVKIGHEQRAASENYWIQQLSCRIIKTNVAVAIIPGIRFPNEVDWIRKARGVILKVTRYNADGSLFISPDRDPNDPMETILNRIVPDHEVIVHTEQQDWLTWQGISFANYIERRLYREWDG